MTETTGTLRQIATASESENLNVSKWRYVVVKITRTRVGITVGVLLCALGAASLGDASASLSSTTTEAATIAKEVRNLAPASSAELTNIYAKARGVALQAGEPSPTSMETAVATTGSAMTLGGAVPDSNDVIDPRTDAPWSESAVDVVTMRGHFTIDNAPVKHGAPPPSGTSLTVTIDRHTERVIGVQLSSEDYDLSKLGATVVKWGES
jgi:hypothetical protein